MSVFYTYTVSKQNASEVTIGRATITTRFSSSGTIPTLPTYDIPFHTSTPTN